MQSNLWNVFDSRPGLRPHSRTIIQFLCNTSTVLKIKMRHGQKQHSSVYMIIVKYDIFKLEKDALGLWTAVHRNGCHFLSAAM